MTAPGAFVTIEGPEGAGKTTQAELLRHAAAKAGIDVVLAREPGGTELGEQIRSLLLRTGVTHEPRADALLFNAARAQLVAEVIRPARSRGALVVCARFADSTLAYQGYGAGLPIDELRAIERAATGGLRPDLTILLDLPVELGLGRKSDEQTRFEADFPADFHRRVRDGFLALAADQPDRWAVVDAARATEAVAADVVAAAARLPGLERLVAAASARHPASEPEQAALRIRP